MTEEPIPDELVDGWYLFPGDVIFPDRLRITSVVNLVLGDGADLIAHNGIRISKGNSLTMTAQSTGESMSVLTKRHRRQRLRLAAMVVIHVPGQLPSMAVRLLWGVT